LGCDFFGKRGSASGCSDTIWLFVNCRARRPLLQKPKFIRIGQPPLRVEIHSEIAGVEFDECYRRSEVCSVTGVDVRFICLNDLRVNKAAAGRTKDLADLEALSDIETS
jgi:hypothetical protein